MNKAQKYFQPQFIHQLKPEQVPISNSLKQSNHQISPNTQSLTLSMIKLNSSNLQTQTIIVNNPHEQQELLENLQWRKKTLSPVVKIIEYYIEMSDYGFPKKYKLNVQNIVKEVKNLKNVQLADSLYLIKYCILGIQTLVLNYHHLNPNTIFYGINSKNQCKVWLSVNLCNHNTSSEINYNSSTFIHSILQNIYAVSSIACKNNLQIYINQINKCQNIGFDGALRRLEQFAKRFRITIGNCLQIFEQKYKNHLIINHQIRNLQTSRGHHHHIPQQHILHQSRKSNNHQTKVNFRYFSPASTELKHSVIHNNIAYKSCFIQNQKPKITFSYISNNNQVYNSQFKSTIISPYNQQVNFKFMPQQFRLSQSIIRNQEDVQINSNNQNNNNLSNKNSSIYNIKVTNQQSTSFIKQNSPQQKLKQEQNLQDIYKKLQNSNKQKTSIILKKSSINQKQKQNDRTVQTVKIQDQTINSETQKDNFQLKNNNNVKNSISTAHQSQMIQNSNIQIHYDKDYPPFTTQQQIKPRNISEFEYNFGGLLPLTCKQTIQSQYINNSPRRVSPQKNAFHNKQHTLNLQNFIKPAHWDFKVTGLFSQNKKSVLKESVHCGQDVVKLSVPAANSKLQKLGQLGRCITSAILTEGQQN